MVRIISQTKRRGGGGFQSLNWLGRESQGKVRPKVKIKLPYSDKFHHQQQQRLISESKQKYCNSKEVVCPLQEKRKHYRPQSHYHTTHTHSVTTVSRQFQSIFRFFRLCKALSTQKGIQSSKTKKAEKIADQPWTLPPAELCLPRSDCAFFPAYKNQKTQKIKIIN